MNKKGYILKSLTWINILAIVQKNMFSKLVLEDIQYPKELHELHNDYPLALYKIEIKREMLCDY